MSQNEVKDMAKATYRQVINHKVFNVGDDLPELGSLRFVSGGYGEIAEIEGNIADLSKLPTDVKQGSQAYFLDTQDVYKFDESQTKWVKQGE